jgi:hypothetical protein
MATEFCQQTGFLASKLASKFLFQQFSSSKSKLEDFMQGYFSFLGKIVIEVLKCKLPT